MSRAQLRIRPDMPDDRREAPQHSAPRFLDRLLLEAFTAHTADEAQRAKSSLADLQEQCLKHIMFINEIEGYFRSVADITCFETDEEAYTELVGFIAGVGASLAGVSHQLGFACSPDQADE